MLPATERHVTPHHCARTLSAKNLMDKRALQLLTALAEANASSLGLALEGFALPQQTACSLSFTAPEGLLLLL